MPGSGPRRAHERLLLADSRRRKSSRRGDPGAGASRAEGGSGNAALPLPCPIPRLRESGTRKREAGDALPAPLRLLGNDARKLRNAAARLYDVMKRRRRAFLSAPVHPTCGSFLCTLTECCKTVLCLSVSYAAILKRDFSSREGLSLSMCKSKHTVYGYFFFLLLRTVNRTFRQKSDGLSLT